MSLLNYKWKKQDLNQQDEQKLELLKAAGLSYSPAFLRLCVKRGLDTREKIEQATDKQPQLFHDPFLLHNMDKAVERIQTAIYNGERIIIYGDYDADGITATAILYEGLETLGANVGYYLPNRFIDGYGPNLERYKQLIADGCELIITCDNGVTGHEAIAYANTQGVDVIVTDHHALPDVLPDAYAIVHTRHPEGNYPFDDLCGAGVALKVITALTEEIPTEGLELAAIGTVADLVSLTDENRTIVMSGLSLMTQTQRVGLRMLLGDIDENTIIDEETLGFNIIPRLNAIGRLGDPTPALELLLTFDEALASQNCQLLEEKNNERKALVNLITEEAIQKVESKGEVPSIIIEAGDNWHPGVVGIVASRLVERYNRPALIFAYNSEENNYTGSGRCIEGINLLDLLNENSDYILKYGGHTQAAGMTITYDNFEKFKNAMIKSCNKYQDLLKEPPSIEVDLTLDAAEVSVEFIEEVQSLGPFGTNNKKPIFEISDANINDVRVIGQDNNHTKLKVNSKLSFDKNLDVIAFYKADDLAGLQVNDNVNLVGELSINVWQQYVNPQLQLLDAAVIGQHWQDKRSSKVPADFFSTEDALYLFQHEKLAKHYENSIPASSEWGLYNDSKLTSNKKTLVIVEVPNSLNALEEKINNNHYETIILGAFINNSCYLAGELTRNDFTKLYTWLIRNNRFTMSKDFSKLSKDLQIPELKLRTILNVFYKLSWINIEKDNVSFTPPESGVKVDLLEEPLVKVYQSKYEAEKLLVYGSLEQIKDHFIKKG